MPNKRIYYATKGLAIRPSNKYHGGNVLSLSASGVNPSGLWEVPRGVQSAGITTTYNLEQVFQQGQLSIYENIEERPDIEVTISRVLDGTCPLYLMTTDDTVGGSGTPGIQKTLAERASDFQVDIAILVYDQAQSHASGAPVSQVMCSGMYLSSISYTFPVDGNATEECTYVGNNKLWDTANGGTGDSTSFPSQDLIATDEDASQVGALTNKGVVRRENFDITNSTLPTQIPSNDKTTIQNISVSVDLGREEILALGQKDAVARFITFPVEVTTSIEVVTSEGDVGIEAKASVDNLVNETIILKTDHGLTIDLGTKNKLTSVDFTGGDTGGGNVTVTYNYSTFNDFTVSHTYFG